jgi:hypothetical protein
VENCCASLWSQAQHRSSAIGGPNNTARASLITHVINDDTDRFVARHQKFISTLNLLSH